MRSGMHIEYWWGKPEGKKPLGKPERRWVDDIKRDLGEIGWNAMDWIDLAQDRDQWRAWLFTDASVARSAASNGGMMDEC
jgi:hypothetical protein